jgi:hypothetical protein
MKDAVHSGFSAADFREHARTYRKFLAYARVAAIAKPLFVGFLLYWSH